MAKTQQVGVADSDDQERLAYLEKMGLGLSEDEGERAGSLAWHRKNFIGDNPKDVARHKAYPGWHVAAAPFSDPGIIGEALEPKPWAKYPKFRIVLDPRKELDLFGNKTEDKVVECYLRSDELLFGCPLEEWVAWREYQQKQAAQLAGNSLDGENENKVLGAGRPFVLDR